MTERTKNRLSWALTAVLVAVVVWRYWPSKTQDLGPAPALVVPTLSGEPFDLAAQRGRVTVVNVWATWCGPCRVELPMFASVARDHPDVSFVAIATDDGGANVVGPYAAPKNLPFPVGIDPGAQAVATLPGGVSVYPTTFVIDRRGRVVVRHEGLLVGPALSAMLRRFADD